MTSFLASSRFSTLSWACRSGLPFTLLLYITQARLSSFRLQHRPERNRGNSGLLALRIRLAARANTGGPLKHVLAVSPQSQEVAPRIKSLTPYFAAFLYFDILAKTDRLSSPLLMPAFALSLPASPRLREGPSRACAGDGDGLGEDRGRYVHYKYIPRAARKHASQAIARTKSDSVFRLPFSAAL